MKNNESKKRKSSCNHNRACYLTEDGKYYVYEIWDAESNCIVTQKLEVGKDFSEEWTIFLDETDYKQDMNDRYQRELRDQVFDAGIGSCEEDFTDGDTADPWNELEDRSSSPEEILFAEPEPENQQALKVRRVIDEECSVAQQDFFFDHFGMGIQLEEMRQAEAERTGKLVSSAAMTNRKNKILDKAAKALGAERVKRHMYPKKD